MLGECHFIGNVMFEKGRIKTTHLAGRVGHIPMHKGFADVGLVECVVDVMLSLIGTRVHVLLGDRGGGVAHQPLDLVNGRAGLR